MGTLTRHGNQELDHTYRMSLVRAGMVGASFYLSDKEVFLFAFLDYLHLFFQPQPTEDPLVFLLWEGTSCRFTSFGDLYFANKYHLTREELRPPKDRVCISNEDNVWLSIHRVRRLESLERQYPTAHRVPKDTVKQDELLLPDDSAMRDARVLLHGERAASAWSPSKARDILSLLTKSVLCGGRPQYPGTPTAQNIPELNYEHQILPILDSFRGALDDVFAEAMSEPMQLRGHKPALGNVFCAVRSVVSGSLRHGWFPYTAALLLSRKQQSDLQKWCDTGCRSSKGRPCPLNRKHTQTCVNALEGALGLRSRSVADAALCSGVIDFARQPGDSLWDRADSEDASDQARVTVERCIYPPRTRASLYYVPIHVGGMPWLAVFTFTATNYSDRWMHNYTFYRDIIQQAGARLRLEAKQEYIRQLVRLALPDLQSWSKTPTEIESAVGPKWDLLARVFPFPRVKLLRREPFAATDRSGAPTVASELAVPGIGSWYLVAEDNPFLGSPQVRWGAPKPDALAQEVVCQLRAQFGASSNNSVRETARLVAVAAHLLEGPIKEMKSLLHGRRYDQLGARMDEVSSLGVFAMAMIDEGRRASLLTQATRSTVGRLVEQITWAILDTLECHSRTTVSVNPRIVDIARQLLSCPSSRGIDLALLGEETVVSFIPVVVKAVVRELTLNAVRHQAASEPAIAYALTSRPRIGLRAAVILGVTNASDEPLLETAARAADMTRGSPSMLGITTIREACQACDYEAPAWQALTTTCGADMVATVQIGEIA
ncbi:MAG: hypothetical protein NTW87_11875 [Planctomycetota bacterium]|nr:hypothetical protein [Planctomycetota bacterium]